VIEAAVIGFEKVAFTTASTETPVALLAGSVEETAGGATAVVKLQVKVAASAFPARSLTALVTVAVYVVAWASGAEGVKVPVVPLTVMAPATAGLMENAVGTSEADDIASENVTLMVALIGTLVA